MEKSIAENLSVETTEMAKIVFLEKRRSGEEINCLDILP
jgi:hypothetical protein